MLKRHDCCKRPYKQVQDHFVKNQGDVNMDIVKAKPLLYAHLMRLEIPDSLKGDLLIVLEHVHLLLNGLVSTCLEQRFVTATVNVIEMS